MTSFWKYFPGTILWLAAIVIWMGVGVKPPYDNTDPPGEDRRSGMQLHTDCLTGLQYLSVRRGGITPRLDANGRQIIDMTGCEP